MKAHDDENSADSGPKPAGLPLTAKIMLPFIMLSLVAVFRLLPDDLGQHEDTIVFLLDMATLACPVLIISLLTGARSPSQSQDSTGPHVHKFVLFVIYLAMAAETFIWLTAILLDSI